MARRKNQEERKSGLLNSAARVVAGKGLAMATLSEIADGAGMSANAALYYYPNLKAMLEDVQRQAAERFVTARHAAIAKSSNPKLKLAQLLASGLPTSADDELCRLLYELSSYARSDAAYAAQHIQLFERQVALYMSVLEAGVAAGQFKLSASSLEIARALVVMEDGLGLHLTNKVQSLDHDSAFALLRTACAVATGVDAEELYFLPDSKTAH